MIPELEERKREFLSAKEAVERLLSGISDEQFNLRVREASWCIAECLSHLVVIGQAHIPRFHSAIEGAAARGWVSNGPFRYGLLGRLVDGLIGDHKLPPRRIKAPRIFIPSSICKYSKTEVVTDYVCLQDSYVAVLEEADGLDLRRIRVTSPVTRYLRLSLGIWLKVLSAHQRRHLWQAARVKEALRVDG